MLARVWRSNRREYAELMHPACALIIYMMIATMSAARSFLRAKPVGITSTRWQRYMFCRLSSLPFYLHFTQVRLAFLSSVTNEPVCEAATKPRTPLAAGRRQRKSMLAHWFINVIRHHTVTSYSLGIVMHWLPGNKYKSWNFQPFFHSYFSGIYFLILKPLEFNLLTFSSSFYLGSR